MLCRAIDPTFQDNKEREEFVFSTLAPLKPLLRQTRCQILTSRSAGASLLVVFHLRRNPCEEQVPYKTTIIGNVQRINSGTSNPQLSSKAEDETDRCGAICHLQHNDVVEHAQRLSSNPWSPLSTDVHILACVHSTGKQGAHANSLQQLHTFVSGNHHEHVSSPFATPCHVPKHAASQAATLVGILQEHTIHSLVKTSQTPSCDADKPQFPWSQSSAGAARNFAEPEILGN